MATTSSNKDSLQAEQLEQVADILKVIAHPVRLKILKRLGSQNRANVSEIIEHTGLEQSLISHHLTKMKDKGILISERSGKNVYYKLKDHHLLNIFDCMKSCDLID